MLKRLVQSLAALVLAFGMAATSGVLSAAAAEDGACPTVDIVTQCREKPCHYPHPSDSTKFVHCEPNEDGVTGAPVVKDCPEGLEWNDQKKQCDWPWLATGTARTDLSTSASIASGGSTHLRATLRLAHPTWAIPDRKITFTDSDGNVLCSAVTNEDGQADCEAIVEPSLIQAYTASYQGLDNQASATATGVIIL